MQGISSLGYSEFKSFWSYWANIDEILKENTLS